MLSRKRIIATIDAAGHYAEQSLVCIIPNGVLNDREQAAKLPLEYILGIINSRLESFYFAAYIIDYSLGGGLIHATPGAHDKFIIPKPDRQQIGHMVRLVRRMLDLRTRLTSASTDHERTLLERQIMATDRQIDRLVYELYELTDAEIAIVEEAAAE